MSDQSRPTFTQDWFSRSIPAWRAVLDGLSKRNAYLKILEVGVFEGRSTCWLLENFCKTPECGIVAVDSFAGSEEHRGLQLGGLRTLFERNVAAIGSACPVDVRQGDSLTQLCRLVGESPAREFDFISIDASHRACDVIGDAVLAFRLLKPGGVMADA